MSLPDDYRALRGSAALVDRSARGLLILTGADRRSYLQGLLSNDIEALTAGAGCYATYLTPQGRMIADVRVFETGESLLVDLDRSVAKTVGDRWAQFVFSEDVQVENRTESTTEIGVYGPAAAAVAHAAFATSDGESPAEGVLDRLPLYGNVHWLFKAMPVHALRSDDVGVLGFDLIVTADAREEIVRLLTGAGARNVGELAADVTRVEGGRPLFHVDMDEETIPLEAGLEDRAISQTKGCYVGQEIIIRVLHRGHGRVARKLVGIAFQPGTEVPRRGDRIASAARDVGSITSAVQSLGLGHPIALGYVHRDFAQPGTLLDIGAAQGVVSPLPFVPVEQTRVQVPG